MKIQPLSPTFDSEKYLQSKMKDIAKLSGIHSWIGDQGELISSPIFDIVKIYKNYYKLAVAGKITREILNNNNDIYIDRQYAWVNPSIHEEVTYFDDDLEINKTAWIPLDGNRFDFYNPVLPMVNQFALFAALSNTYLKEGDLNQSMGFTVQAAQVSGRIDRYRTEMYNFFYIKSEIEYPLEVAQFRGECNEKNKKIFDSAKGGKAKGEKGEEIAKNYWALCIRSSEYGILLRKHPRMGRKFSDELFDLIKTKEQSGEIVKIQYGSTWFYENVTLKFRNKK